MLLFSASRIVFALVNPGTVKGEFLLLLLAGFRYDLAAICWLLIPLAALHLYPNHFSLSKNLKTISGFLFSIIISIALFANIADTGWFAFQKKRSTSDVFSVLTTGDDLLVNLPAYILDYWYLFFIWIFFIILCFNLSKKIAAGNQIKAFPSVPVRLISFLILTGLYIIGIRGGVQLKPLSTQTAAAISGPEAAPFVLNTPYTLIKSIGDATLTEAEYMSMHDADILFPLHRKMSPVNPSGLNVVIVILESFSMEYTGIRGNKISYTPFLDSLAKVSLNFPFAYANGKRSIEGLPAILTSVPALMNEPFITSHYNTNKLNSPASLLKKSGYSSAFFHGGNNGTMGFDNFTALAGYDKYYGKNQYDGKSENDDGYWGIYDHAFYEFVIRKLNAQPQPFTTAIFSLSSHHPYSVPEKFPKQFEDGSLPILKSIRYADAALRMFFDNASKQSWFTNTAFILTADHTGPALTPQGNLRAGMYEVPLMIYAPGRIAPQQRNDIAQHCDILPTVLHLAGYSGNYSSFGRNLFDENSVPLAVNFSNGNWQLISEELTVLFDGDDIMQCSRTDDKTTVESANCNEVTKMLRAIIQQYRHALLTNSLVTE
jgi:phosphoglycerol transferase MdoB-like AlkP superfamily enzyme